MKKFLFVIGAAGILLCSSCTKEKHCRCSIIGTQNTRIVTISSGDCGKLNSVTYYDALDTAHVENVVCSDYIFEADSNIIYQK